MKKKLLQIVPLIFLTFFLFLVGEYLLEDNPQFYETVDENGVFHIYTEKDMRWFLEYVSDGHNRLDAVLEADIDMAETKMIGTDYGGHFDGQGYSISNLKWSLWYRLEETAVVENLSLKDVDIQNANKGTGGIAYRNYGMIRNCQVSGRIEALNYAGGIVSGNFGTLADCINYADVTSTETGETFNLKGHYDGYGAGGITGISGTSRSDWEEYDQENNVIINCTNYGTVTAQTLAAGICAYMEDRTHNGAANLSVQELIETTDFEVYEPEPDPSVQGKEIEEDKIGPADIFREGQDKVKGIHFSMIGCKNYGTVMVKQVNDINNRYTSAAGICGDLNYGDIYRCANLGKVMIAEDAPKVSDTGWVYANKPYAITRALGLSPSIHHIVDCVNLKDTMPGTMWPESVMELTEEEFVLWEQEKLPYVSNNWRFQLEEAVRVCSLEPLGVEESPSSGEQDNVFRCGEFVLSLPEGFAIEPEYIEDTFYALHITVDEKNADKLPEELMGEESRNFEVWLLRKETGIETAIEEVVGIENKMKNMNHKYFMEKVYETLPNYWFLKIDTINPPFHICVNQRNFTGKRIFMEMGIPFQKLMEYQQEGSHVLGNYLSMALEGNLEDGLEARWLMVFTNNKTNIHPTREFVDVIEQSFYPLDGKEKLIEIQKGDTLSALAKQYRTELPGSWKLLADMNGIQEPDQIKYGTYLLVPDKASYEKKPEWIGAGWFSETEEDH